MNVLRAGHMSLKLNLFLNLYLSMRIIQKGREIVE